MEMPLRELLSPDQYRLLHAIYEPFSNAGKWPIWQYVDLTLDARFGLDAAAVLASLPQVGEHSPMSMNYGLIWRENSYAHPQPDNKIALTVAGMARIPEAGSLLMAFLVMIRHLVDEQRRLIPSPGKVVEATVLSTAIAEQVLTASIEGLAAPPVDATMRKLRELLGHEPFLYHVAQPGTGEPWTVQVPAVLRAFRGIGSVDDYLDRVVGLVAPDQPPPVPPSFSALDIPYAIGYLDAVWKNATGSHLFVNLDPASIARLTLTCGDQEDFNSLMSALADALGQVVAADAAKPPQGGALEKIRDHLAAALDPEAADRAGTAIETLIELRHIRVSAQHADARHKAVTAFKKIGLTYPPHSWEQAWAQVASLAKGAMDVLREEVHEGLHGAP